MPILKNQVVFAIARNVKAFLNLEVGITRSGVVPEPGWATSAQQERMTKAHAKLRKQDAQLERSRQRLATKEREIGELRSRLSENLISAEADGVQPENIVWIFGFGRSGSTWINSMMGELAGHTVWDEPLIGQLFGGFYYTGIASYPAIKKREEFVLGPHKEVRSRLIRSFFLERARAGFSQVARGGILVVKEPNGSIGAPLLMEALPESRMILLIRDPRDVMASFVDSQTKGGWGHKLLEEDNIPEFNAQAWASIYLQHMGNARQAYEAHKGPKTLVRYEDLRADTLGTMRRLCSELGLAVKEGELTRAVEKHSWENIPEQEKGEGKFYRKGIPGGWKEDLTPEQIKMVERVAAPVLNEFYSGAGGTG